MLWGEVFKRTYLRLNCWTTAPTTAFSITAWSG